jgi:hypothetical protein
MKRPDSRLFRRLISATAVLGFLAVGYAADDQSSQTPQPAATSAEVQDLKRQLAEQQKQIEELRLILLGQKKQIETVSNAAATPAEAAAPVAPAPVVKEIGQIASATPMVPPAPAPAPVPFTPPAAAQKEPAQGGASTDTDSPLQLKIGGAYITPVGFMDLTNTYRSTNAGSSLQTNFGSIPYNNGVTGRLSEDRISAQNSRIGFRVDALMKGWNVLGYYEGDFVGGYGNANFNYQVSSNSVLYRLRLYWVDMRKDKFEFLAGQSWSMLTPNRKQISALPADLFYSQVVDVNYMNGLTWGRIPGVRFLIHPSEKVTWGLSLENSSQYFGGSGGGGVPTLPSALSSSIAGELDQNVSNGVSIPNIMPDVISKLAFDPISKVHFEIAGVTSGVKLFNPTTQDYFTKFGAGGSVNANVELFPGLRLVTNNFWSDGEGRYLFGVVPDFIVRSDGSPSLIHAGSTVSGFEYAHKNSQFYAYYGGIYAGRDTALDANGKTLIGYGYAGSANSQNKTTQEATFGWTQTWWRDPKYGAFQTMFQYAYFFRDPWYVNLAAGAPRNTHEDAVWFNIRYLLPGQAPALTH